MDSDYVNARLSGIQTLWTLVRQAHGAEAELVKNAQQQLLKRYGGPVQRYLRGLVRDADAAEDLFQEFAVRLLKGDLHNADPQRGKFRNYVKGVLFHLVALAGAAAPPRSDDAHSAPLPAPQSGAPLRQRR